MACDRCLGCAVTAVSDGICTEELLSMRSAVVEWMDKSLYSWCTLVPCLEKVHLLLSNDACTMLFMHCVAAKECSIQWPAIVLGNLASIAVANFAAW
jgi:hypothetical protein